MTGKRICERAAPRSSTQSFLAALAERFSDLASLSDTIRCKANAVALALSAMLILLSPIAARAADGDGCNYLRNNPGFYDNATYNVSSTGPTTIINQAPFGPQTGIVNFAAGTEVYYAYTVSSSAVNARLNRAPLAGVATVFVDSNISNSGSITLPVDTRSMAASAYVPGAGSGTVTWTIYCAARATQAVASATGTVGTAISFTPVTASFGYGSYTYALSGGTLPSGLAFATATGAITGTPTAALAATTFTVTVTHQGMGSAFKTFQLTVNAAAPTIAAAFSPTSVATGVSSTLTLTITNPNAATQLTGVAVSAAALPGGLTGSSATTTCSGGTATLAGGTLSLSGATLNASASCTVSITVSSATPGSYSYTSGTVSASGPTPASGSTATTPTPLTVTAPAPTVTSVAPTTGPAAGGTSVIITGTAFTGTMGAGGVRFGATNATTYTVNSDTQITAVAPAHAAGIIDVTVVAPGGTSATSVADRFTYVAAPVASSFTASAVAYDVSNATFSVSGHATNSPTFYAVGSATTAQGGSVSVNAAGLVTYTAPTGFRGNDSFTFTATNLGGTSAPATVTVPVSNPVLVSVFPVGSGTRGTALSGVQIDTTGGRSPYNCSTALNSGALPAGTQLNSDCTISGTPAASGTFTFTASVTDSSLGTGPFTQATGPLVLTIAAPTITLSPASGALPGGSVGTAYSQSFTAGGGTSTYAYARTVGTLPPGLTLTGGTLSGTPTTTGTFNFDITATDSSTAGSGGPYSRVQSYSITMVQGGQTISFGPLPNASFSASPLNLSATASSGLTVDFASTTATICTVSGTTLTLHQMGTCSITASQAGDADWNAASDVVQSFTVTPANLVLTAGAESGNQVGASYSQSNTASGGIAPYSFALNAGAFVPGTSIDPNTGLVSGTPTMAGTFSYIVAVTDSQGPPVTASGPVTTTTIAKGNQTISFTSTAPGNAAAGGAAYTVTATATSGLAVVFSVDGASTGCAVSGNSVTFTSAGTCTINANQAGDSNWNAAPQLQQSFAVVVVPTVIGVSPPSGPVSQVVTVSGTGFSTTPGNNIVRFGGVAGSVTAASATSLTVTAPATGSGPAIVTVTVDGQTSTETVTFTFIDKPIAADRSGVVVAFNSPGTAIDLSGSISGGPHSSIAIGTAPTQGTTSIAGDVVTYTPTSGYTGPDSFTYTATGAGGTSNIATVSLEVIEAVPTAPTRSVAAQAGSIVTFDLTGGATGAPFTGAAIVSITPADAAEVELVEGGTAMNRSYSLRFTSRSNEAQAVTMLYTLSNGGGTSAPLSLIVQIDARPDPSDDPDVRGLEAAETGAARRTAETQIRNFGRRMEQLHDGRCAPGMGVSLNLGIPTGATAEQQRANDDPTQPGWIGRDGRAIGQGTGPLQAADDTSRGTAANGTAATINADRFGSGVSCDDGSPLRDPGNIELWSNGEVTIGSRDATTGTDRFDISTSGLTAGGDIVLAPGVTIGIGGGYGRDQTDVGSNGSQVEASSWVAGAYGSFRPTPNGFIDVLAGAGGIDFDLTRYVGAADSFATAQRNADLFFGSVRAGIDRNDGPWRWSLFGGVEASRTNFGAYVEVGPESYSLAYDERGMDTIDGLVGGRIEYSFLWGDTVLTPRGRFEYRYDFEQAEGQRVRFADWMTGPSFMIDADGWSRSQVTAELGIGAALPTGWQMGADVTGNLSGNSRSIGLRLEISQRF